MSLGLATPTDVDCRQPCSLARCTGTHSRLYTSLLVAFTKRMHAHASTSTVVGLPEHPGVWQKHLCSAQLLQDPPSRNACLVPAPETMSVVGTMGLTLQFHGTVCKVPQDLHGFRVQPQSDVSSLFQAL